MRHGGPVVGMLALAATASACVTPTATNTCGDGALCPAPQVCHPAGSARRTDAPACVEPALVDVCAQATAGDDCALGTGVTGQCRGGVCEPVRCGDAIVDRGEACDDGNTTDDDDCSNACATPTCGDQIVQGSEGCDLGAGNGDDRACTATCADAACGDGKLWLGVEACDDGNAVDDDGCRTTCALPSCGDGIIQAGEACDDGAANGDDRACTAACRIATCGDGKMHLGVETCDLGAGNGAQLACTDACQTAACGDGKTWLGVEACDDGNAIDDDGCRTTCALPSCGDRIVQAGEDCDDGDANGDDRACTAACRIATCGDGKVHLGVEDCDEGAGNADDAACTRTCADATCGDGLVWSGEEVCDDANASSGDGCRADCGKLEVCGDGTVDVGEACDDGAAGQANPADGCDACRTTSWQRSVVVGATAVQGTSITLLNPSGIVVGRDGARYIADTANHRIRRITLSGVALVAAGTGSEGFGGDSGPATSAELSFPSSVAVDGLDNLYIVDRGNRRIRRVDAASGLITTIAGTSTFGHGGDNGPAAAASFMSPSGIAVDGLGNLFVSDTGARRVRRIDARTGIITTYAGNGTSTYATDVLATATGLGSPGGLAVDAQRNLYIADSGHQRIRRVDATTGVIRVIAGDGTSTLVNGVPAVSTGLRTPVGVAVATDGTVLIADYGSHRLRRVDPAGIISTLAGNGASTAPPANGVPATTTHLTQPSGVAIGVSGEVLALSAFHGLLRRIDAAGIITTIAGGSEGAGTSPGDGGPATAAPLGRPHGAIVPHAGSLYLADRDHRAVRRIDESTGTISTIGAMPFVDGLRGVALASGRWIAVASGALTHGLVDVETSNVIAGLPGLSGDPDGFFFPNGLTMHAGIAYVADRENHRVQAVVPYSGQTPTTVAGGLGPGFNGDGMPGGVQLSSPRGLAVDGLGRIYIADSGNCRVRRLGAEQDIIETVAGSGACDDSGDGGPATAAGTTAWDVAAAPDGSFYILDRFSKIRRVGTDGIIQTVVGTGNVGTGGDGGPATAASVGNAQAIAVDAAGRLLITETTQQMSPLGSVDRVRRVDPDGRIYTIAGTIDPEGTGPLLQARLADPRALAIADEMVLVAAGANGVIEAVRAPEGRLDAVIGRYPHDVATPGLARFMASTVGEARGVAWDLASNRAYVSLGNRIYVATAVDLADATTWTIASLAGTETAGFADGVGSAARFREPGALHLEASSGVLYVADTGNHVIRAIALPVGPGDPNVTTVAGTPETFGDFGDGGAATSAGMLGPLAVTRCPSGDVYVADTGNHRVRRIAATTQIITTVLGDGSPSSAGEGRPSAAFPVDRPEGITCDPFGNVAVTSSTAVRLLLTDGAGVVDGTGEVATIYGAAPQVGFPEDATSCLSGIAARGPETLLVTDRCLGVLIELRRVLD